MDFNTIKKIKNMFILSIIIAIAVSGCNDFHSSPFIPLDENGDLPVQIQDYNGKIFIIYASEETQLTNLTSDISQGQFDADVSNSTNCVVGNSIDFWDDNNYFQGIITNVVGNNIEFISQLTENYSYTNTVVKCGNWHLNVDGSVNKKTFYINPPNNKSWDVESVGMSFIDTSDHDSSMFGSRSSLSNGFTGGIQNGEFQRLFLITKNLGFLEHGFDYTEIEKAPSGRFGFFVDLQFEKKYGAIPQLIGSENQKMLFNVNDDLTSEEDIVLPVRVHYKDE